MVIWARAALFLTLGLLAAPALAGSCRALSFQGMPYTVCQARADEDLRMFLRDETSSVLGGFAAVDAALASEGKRLAFGMNAGMYHQDRRPVGYYVEKGTEIAPLQRKPGPGNFGMQPNGVFCIESGRFSVIETLAFDAARPACTYASQSGPMLVLSGALHPKFRPESESLNIRNGVGVSDDGQVAYFVISDRVVNFFDFARMFRDALKVQDALFLDGSISRLYAPQVGRDDFGLPLGPIVGLVVPAD